MFALAETLKAMGIRDAFAIERADFSGMTTAEKLAISDVIHKSFVAVDEEGTEAAAAAAVIVPGAALRPPKPKVFPADHPFVFLIRHNASGAILFAGRLVAPEGGGEIPKADRRHQPSRVVDDPRTPVDRLANMKRRTLSYIESHEEGWRAGTRVAFVALLWAVFWVLNLLLTKGR